MVGEMLVTDTSGRKLHLKINTSTGMENGNTVRDCEKNKQLKCLSVMAGAGLWAGRNCNAGLDCPHVAQLIV
jgi:hypothetical protein